MFDNLSIQLILELLRALIIDELSDRVRERFSRWVDDRSARTLHRIMVGIHLRNRRRLLHRLRTELEQEE